MHFVFDLDGTICFQGKPICAEILQSLIELQEAGYKVIFASARPIRDMLPVIDQKFHSSTMIGGNGALISKDGKVIKSHSFTTNELNEIKKLIHEYHATYLIDGEWNYAYTGPEDHPIFQNVDSGKLAKKVPLETIDPVVKVLILTSNKINELAEKLSKLDVYINRHRNENVLDISPRGINKWSALKSLGIEKHTYIAFGNDANDIAMFENALYSVMIGNHESLAPLAKEMIPLKGDYEKVIADKIRTLSKKFKLLKI